MNERTDDDYDQRIMVSERSSCHRISPPPPPPPDRPAEEEEERAAHDLTAVR